MYVPRHFAVHDRHELVSFIRREPLGILVCATDGKPVATHVPFVVSEEGGSLTLCLHVAKANPQWRAIDGAPVLAIFQGPHAMISAAWYEHPESDVPTWDYSAVHCSGTARIADAAGTRRILERLVEHLEPSWRIDGADPESIALMERAIVGIEIAVTQIEGARKYSQNRSAEDRKRVIEALAGSSRAMDREVALEVRSASTALGRPSTSSG